MPRAFGRRADQPKRPWCRWRLNHNWLRDPELTVRVSDVGREPSPTLWGVDLALNPSLQGRTRPAMVGVRM